MKERKTRRTKHHRGRRGKKKTKNLISNIIIVIAAAVFVYAAFNLWNIFQEYQKGTNEYDDIQNIVVSVQSIDEEGEEVGFEVDFEKLKEMNQDTVAWIRFEEPSEINYPVVLGIDNEKYLNTTFEGNPNAAGTLFIDMSNREDFSDRNTFIYGHNMKNGSMFGKLKKYRSSDFYKENPYFYIYTPDGKESTYQIFSVTVVKDTSDSYTKHFFDDAEYEEYLANIQSLSLYQTGVEVNKDSKIVSLSTCTNVSDDERLLVHGVKISEKMMGE